MERLLSPLHKCCFAFRDHKKFKVGFILNIILLLLFEVFDIVVCARAFIQ